VTGDLHILEDSVRLMQSSGPRGTANLVNSLAIASAQVAAFQNRWIIMMANNTMSDAELSAAEQAATQVKAAGSSIFVIGVGDSSRRSPTALLPGSTRRSTSRLAVLASSSNDFQSVPSFAALNDAEGKPIVDQLAKLSLQISGPLPPAVELCISTYEYKKVSACQCGCANQSWVIKIYVFIMATISLLRTARASMQAIRLQMAGKDTPRTSKPSFGGKREHLIFFLTFVLLIFSILFFTTGDCTNHWTEVPRLLHFLELRYFSGSGPCSSLPAPSCA